MEEGQVTADWYVVFSYFEMILYVGVNSYAALPFMINVLISGKSIVGRCAVVVGALVLIRGLLFLSMKLWEAVGIFLKNKWSGSYLELGVDVRDLRSYMGMFIRIMPVSILIMSAFYAIRGCFPAISPNYVNDSKLDALSLSGLLSCVYRFLMVVFFFVKIMLCSLKTPEYSPASESMERHARMLPLLFLLLNMICFWGIYKLAPWPLSFWGIFAAYFYSFLGLLPLVFLTDAIELSKETFGNESVFSCLIDRFV